jgi:hypothetical protein
VKRDAAHEAIQRKQLMLGTGCDHQVLTKTDLKIGSYLESPISKLL